MKKNETQKARTKASEVRSQKEQMEDRAFNRMLLWLAGTVLTEVVLLLVNRYYIHARVEELDNLATLHTILGIAPIAGVVLFAGFLYWGLQQRKKGDEHRDGIIQIILASAFLVMGLGAFGMRMYGAAIAPMILGIVPGLGVLMLVFYLYQKEFFVSAFAGGLGILGLWVFRSTGGGTHYYLYLVLALVIIAAVLALVLKLKKAARCSLPDLLHHRSHHCRSAHCTSGSGRCCGLLRHLGDGSLALHPGCVLHLQAHVTNKNCWLSEPAVFFLYFPADEKTPVLYGDLHGFPLEVVAHPKREEGV